MTETNKDILLATLKEMSRIHKFPIDVFEISRADLSEPAAEELIKIMWYLDMVNLNLTRKINNSDTTRFTSVKRTLKVIRSFCLSKIPYYSLLIGNRDY